MGNYGYLHLARVLSYDETRNAYSLQSVGLARSARWPPVPSCVPGLQPGDRVILAAKGSSRDDLVIVGKVGATFPEIADIDGLIAALAAKADDVELTALTGRVDTAEDTLVAHAGELTTLDGRLDAVEPTVADHTAALADLTARVARLEQNPFREDRDLFGDLASTLARADAVSPITLTNGTFYGLRAVSRSTITATSLRMATAVAGAGAGATGNIGLYVGNGTTLNLMRSGTIALNTLGRINHTLSSTYDMVGVQQFVIGLLPLGYTTAPQMAGRAGVAHSTLINPAATTATAFTKAGLATLPASVDLADGSWTITGTSKAWAAIA